MADAFPVLWICGPGGVGKTTAGWAYYARLAAAGVRAGFVEPSPPTTGRRVPAAWSSAASPTSNTAWTRRCRRTPI